MRMTLARASLLLGIMTPCVSHAQAQQNAASSPPAVLVISREDVKPGKSVAHTQWESGWPAAFAKAKYPTTYLAATSMSGPHEAWYFVGYPSWAAMEQDNARMAADSALAAEDRRLSAGDGDFINGSTNMIAVNMPNLTHGTADLPRMRYFEVITYRMRPGHGADFGKMATMIKDAYTSARIDRPWAIYRVASGAPDGTFLVILPMRTLAAMDSARTVGAAIDKALGANAATLDKMEADGVMGSTSQVLAFSPRMSYVDAAFRAGDPSFWK